MNGTDRYHGINSTVRYHTHREWCEHLRALHQLAPDHAACADHDGCQVPPGSYAALMESVG